MWKIVLILARFLTDEWTVCCLFRQIWDVSGTLHESTEGAKSAKMTINPVPFFCEHQQSRRLKCHSRFRRRSGLLSTGNVIAALPLMCPIMSLYEWKKPSTLLEHDWAKNHKNRLHKSGKWDHKNMQFYRKIDQKNENIYSVSN